MRRATVQLLHTNDMHGVIAPVDDRGGAAHLKTAVQRLRRENPKTLLVDAGDSVHGQVVTDLDQGLAMADVMNHVGYDVGSIGNHDFAWALPALQKRLRSYTYPIVCANVKLADGTPLPNTTPWTVRQAGDVKVGCIGILTPETAHEARSESIAGVRFEDDVTAIRENLAAARVAGADMVVILSHSGLQRDRELARHLAGEGVVFIGAHSHDRTETPVEVDGNYIVQAGFCGKELGALELSVDLEQKKVVGASGRLISIDPKSIPVDPEVAALVARYEAAAANAMDDVVAELPHPMERNNHHDSALGNLVTDAMRSATDADVAL